MILEFYLAASLPLFFLLVFLEGGQRRVLAFLAWGLTAAVISLLRQLQPLPRSSPRPR